MTLRQQPVHHRFFAVLFLFLATCGPRVRAEEPLAANEILDRAREIMKPPVQYRIETNGIESVVSQKELGEQELGEQGIAIRTETVAPGFEQIMLMIDGDMLKWSVATKKGYRLSGVLGDMIKKGQAVAIGVGTPSADPTTAPAGMTVTLQEPTTLDGEECYVIDEILPSGIIDTVLSTLPAGGPIPKGTRSAVSKKTGRLMETMQLWRKDDGPAVVTRYRDITPNAELSNELFLPPDDVEFKTVGSLEEYHTLEIELFKERFTPPKPTVSMPTWLSQPLERDANGSPFLIPPEGSGLTKEQYTAEADRIALEHWNDNPDKPGDMDVIAQRSTLAWKRIIASRSEHCGLASEATKASTHAGSMDARVGTQHSRTLDTCWHSHLAMEAISSLIGLDVSTIPRARKGDLRNEHTAMESP
jgi:hypothetical protein